MKLNHIFLAGLTAFALTACDESFDDWATVGSNEQQTLLNFGQGTVTGGQTIDFADIQGDYVKVCSLSSPSASADGFETTYTITLDNAKTYPLTADGQMAVSDLRDYLISTYGQAPTEHTLSGVVTAVVSNGSQATKFLSEAFTITAKLSAPEIEQAYYFTGSLNGWDNTNTSYKLTNDGSDPYANPTFTCRIPASEDGSNIEFKFTPESGLGGDWSGCLTAGNEEGTFAYNNAGGNLVIEAVEGAKFYDITFNMLDLTWSYTAVFFNPFIYFIGATDGWAASEQRLAHQGDGLYTGYVYIADPNGWGVEFKFQKVAGDWGDDSQLNSNNTASVTGDFEKTGDNFRAWAGEGVYFVSINLADNSINGTKVNNMNLVGDFNGWNAADDAQQMTWDAENYCYVITGAGVTANGWKFTTNNSWDINLGGTMDNLVANGDNLSVEGTTIKLYPTRRSNEKIYCTVE